MDFQDILNSNNGRFFPLLMHFFSTISTDHSRVCFSCRVCRAWCRQGFPNHYVPLSCRVRRVFHHVSQCDAVCAGCLLEGPIYNTTGMHTGHPVKRHHQL